MAIFELFSQRRRAGERSGQTDVYQYNDIPAPLRVQISQIAIDAVGKGASRIGYTLSALENPRWVEVEKIFCRERGISVLGRGNSAIERVLLYMTSCDTDDWLDLLELIGLCIEVNGKA